MSGSGSRRVLVAALGSAARGDDGVARRVLERVAAAAPAGAVLIDCADDPLALLTRCAGFDALLVVDAAAQLGAPGRIHRIDVSGHDLPQERIRTSSHAVGLAAALALGRALGLLPAAVTVYAIEGERFERGAPMTAAVAAATEATARAVLGELARALSPRAARPRSADAAAGRRCAPAGAR